LCGLIKVKLKALKREIKINGRLTCVGLINERNKI
jgi:hypothetical protein